MLQILRRHRRPVTGEAIARELEVSWRTVYRDIASLISGRVPIRGEAGVGYVLGEGFDLPPLMFTPDELEAVMLGLRWVARRGDGQLSRAAQDTVAYCDAQRLIIAWCELRQAFRSFRTGRMVAMQVQDQKYPGRRKALLKQMHEELERLHGVRQVDVFT